LDLELTIVANHLRSSQHRHQAFRYSPGIVDMSWRVSHGEDGQTEDWMRTACLVTVMHLLTSGGRASLPTNESTLCFWSHVSDDLAVHILSYVGEHEVLRLAIVCKQWSRASRQLVSSIQLGALTPARFSRIYPNIRETYVSDPSLGADVGNALPHTLQLCQGLKSLPLLTCAFLCCQLRCLVQSSLHAILSLDVFSML
jgi:hypothetical protein